MGQESGSTMGSTQEIRQFGIAVRFRTKAPLEPESQELWRRGLEEGILLYIHDKRTHCPSLPLLLFPLDFNELHS